MYLAGCSGTKELITNEPTQVMQEEIPSSTIDSSETLTPKFELEQKVRDSLTQVYKDEIYRENQIKANRITTLYILAQEKFYSGEYQDALFLINRALRVKETADVLALKGSIYLGLGSIENFVAFWRQALEMDENLPIPPSPAIVEELKRQGLIQ
ncbi:MAG TPA: hypothetical protein DF712_10700 [Balneola sp.]|jgi:tetratricopeptide (TPR) repeat protein|nr:hypothetical protein [Balneola sp.]HAW79009.1 hypothetical protein [Balneola sp.]HBZ37151.1 hypothetical protein [Balneola sp.]HCI70276.1 hypothetical protein [Balneola sp.]HCT52919.1 hypothetical protein [Balneola sp.]|tara:strand:+ start:6404 stop:6868 length:465 start_codon:yes stop_codon:yes gene_type:complete